MAIEHGGATDSGSRIDQSADEQRVDVEGVEEALLVGPDSDVTPTVSVVMPTMNEEEGIAECIQRIKNALLETGIVAEIIISDDSTDRTPEIAREMGAIVVNPDGKGYGYAYRYAFEHARGEYIVIGDADTTYDFEQFPRLLDPVANGDADMVMGSRLEGEIKPGAMPKLHQYIGNPLLTKFLNVFYGAGVSDAHSGFRVFRASMLDELDLQTTGMEFASEMIMDAGARDMTIEEVPIVYHEREGEATLESFRDGWRHVRFMLVNAPSYLFSIPGAAIGGAGILVMMLALLGVDLGVGPLGMHSIVAGGMLIMVGHQIASMGVFATVAGNPIRRPRDRITRYIVEQVTLERAATAGTIVGMSGAAYIAWLTYEWVSSGFTKLPMLGTDMIALTALVLGLQTVFGAFFMSAVAQDR